VLGWFIIKAIVLSAFFASLTNILITSVVMMPRYIAMIVIEVFYDNSSDNYLW